MSIYPPEIEDALKTYPLLSGDELEAQGESLKKSVEDLKLQNSYTEVKLRILNACKARMASLAFYEKYGEWDWDVRLKYNDLLKSLAMPFDESREGYGSPGHPFEISIWVPRSNEIFLPENLPVAPFMGFDQRISNNHFISMTDFSKCAPDEKTTEAFRIQHRYNMECDKDRQEGRGFQYTTEAVDWEEWRGDYDVSFRTVPRRRDDYW